jgi:hypothetical protein
MGGVYRERDCGKRGESNMGEDDLGWKRIK